MRINTNFAAPAKHILPFLTGMLLLISALIILLALVLYFSARQMGIDNPELETRLENYRTREIPQASELMSNDQLRLLRTKVKAVNELTGGATLTLSTLLAHLEELIPDGVWLLSLQYRSHENEAKLSAAAFQADQLTEFMSRLERSGYFSQVLLTRQNQQPEGMQNAIQFDIQLKGRL